MEQLNSVHSPEVAAPDILPGVRVEEGQDSSSVKEQTGEKDGNISVRAEKENGEIDKAQLETLAGAIEDFMQARDWSTKVRVHEGSNKTVVQIISNDDGQVIKQMPPEELLNIADKIEEMVGLLISKKV